MNNKSVAIIILNYNSCKETYNLVNSIYKYERIISPHIIVIDNDSNDAITFKQKPIGGCEMILLDENNGYAAGNNVGIKKAVNDNFEYIVIANSDTEIIEDNTISNMIKAMDANNAFILGPGIVDKNRNITSGAGGVSRFGKVKEIPSGFSTWCQCIIGAFFIIRRQLIDEIGYIKENYFLYLEETDYFLTAYRNGFRTLYYPEIKVMHYGGTTTSKVYDYYISRNRFILAEQNFDTPHWLMCLYLFFEYVITDIRQFVACKFGMRKYDAIYRRKMRWAGYKDGVYRIQGKK